MLDINFMTKVSISVSCYFVLVFCVGMEWLWGGYLSAADSTTFSQVRHSLRITAACFLCISGAVCSKFAMLEPNDDNYVTAELQHRKTLIVAGSSPFSWFVSITLLLNLFLDDR